jgi:hypothetical protein
MFKLFVLSIIWGLSVLMLQHFLDYSSKLSLFIFIVGTMLLLRFRKRNFINSIPPLMFVAMLIWLATIQASNEKDWLEEISLLPNIKIQNDDVTIENYRNFAWHDINHSDQRWETRSFDLNKLRSLSLIVAPFHESKYMAHTMLDFEFEGQGNVIISVETRKEKGEEYSLVAGALRQLELIYVFGSERDLLTLRAVHRGSKLHLYPIKADHEFIVALFKDLAESANALHESPQFYRTLRDNCTTTLVKHIDRHYQQKIGLRVETIFPAKAGELLYELDRMDTKLPYQQAFVASRIDGLVKKYQHEDDFSSRLHAELGLPHSK